MRHTKPGWGLQIKYPSMEAHRMKYTLVAMLFTMYLTFHVWIQAVQSAVAALQGVR